MSNSLSRPTRPTDPREPGVLPRGVTICRGCGGLGFDCSMGACRVCGGTGRVRGSSTTCQYDGGRLFVDPEKLPDGTFERSCVRCGARSYVDAKGQVVEPTRETKVAQAVTPPSARELAQAPADVHWAFDIPEPGLPLLMHRFDPSTGRYTLDEEMTAEVNAPDDEGYDDTELEEALRELADGRCVPDEGEDDGLTEAKAETA